MGSEWESDFYVVLGTKIRRQREAAGLSQADLARRLSLSRVSVTNLEAGRQRMLAHQIAAVAEILEVELAALIPELDMPEPDEQQMLHDQVIGQVLARAKEGD